MLQGAQRSSGASWHADCASVHCSIPRNVAAGDMMRLSRMTADSCTETKALGDHFFGGGLCSRHCNRVLEQGLGAGQRRDQSERGSHRLHTSGPRLAISTLQSCLEHAGCACAA